MADFGTIAKPYARALFELAQGSGELEQWATALRAVAAVVADAGAQAYLGRPGLTTTDRAEFLAGVCAELDGGEKFASVEGRNLLALLSENERLLALGEIGSRFEALKARAENTIAVSVTSAVAIDAGLVETLRQSLEKKLGRQVELKLDVDASLIGGAIIRADDMVIDGSVRNRLQRLTDSLIN